MQELLKNEGFIIALLIVTAIVFVLSIISIIKVFLLNRKYKKFIKKLGESENIEEDLETFMYRVDKVEKQNAEIMNECNEINKNVKDCFQKIGMVRYNAYKDVGSDLSFALALLDKNNDGVVLNGIYSREMSNIYAKTVKNGIASHNVSEEEKQAIEKAIKGIK